MSIQWVSKSIRHPRFYNKFHKNLPRDIFNIFFWKNVVLYEIYSKKLKVTNTVCTTLQLKAASHIVEVVEVPQWVCLTSLI